MRRCCAIVLALAWLLPGAAVAAAPSDPLYADATGPGGALARIGWSGIGLPDDPAAQPERGYGVGVPLIVIDTGVVMRDIEAPDGVAEFAGGAEVDLASGRCEAPRNGRSTFLPWPDGDIEDRAGHGTTVASLAAGRVNGTFTVGVAPYAQLVVLSIGPFRAPGLEARLRCALTAAARVIAVRGGTGVVNLSMDIADNHIPPARFARLIAPVVRAGGLVVVAAGNGDEVGSQAVVPHTLAVGVEEPGGLRDRHIDVLAPGAGPGIHVVSADGRDLGAESEAMTSWSAALVSGAAASLISSTWWTPQQTLWRLRGGRGGTARTIDLRPGSLASAVPTADDEVEPNDSLLDATSEIPGLGDARGAPQPRLLCRSARCAPVNGIASQTDDPVDVWVVEPPRGRTVCATVATARRGGLASTIRRQRIGRKVVYVVTVRAKAGLVAYRLTPRLCSGEARVTIARLPARG